MGCARKQHTSTVPKWRQPSPRLGIEDVFNFTLPEPDYFSKGKKRKLWATYYFLPRHPYSTTNKYPLLDRKGQRLGPTLNEKDFCIAALQGSVSFVDDAGKTSTFNYSGLGKTMQVSCKYFDIPQVVAFDSATKGPFSDGATGTYTLFPYRSIAVDKRNTFGTVLYIPQARGLVIKLANGRQLTHDGYFANDTGSAIKGRHIDVFVGFEKQPSFSAFIKSTKSGTFKAYDISDPDIEMLLKASHKAGNPYLKDSGL